MMIFRKESHRKEGRKRMKYRQLGRTGLKVSEISLGAWLLGGIVRVTGRTSMNADPCGYGEMREDEGLAIGHRALEKGINLIDTAPIYGDGESERRVSLIVKESGRKDVIICTKCGVYAEDGRYVRNFSRDVVLREVETSRDRLGRDQLDIVLLHSPTIAEFGGGDGWAALRELKEQGVVRFIGISIFSEPEQAREFIESGLCDVMMVRFNMLDTVMRPILVLALKHGVGIMVREALCNGFLAGLFDENTVFKPDDQRSCWPREQVLNYIRRVEELKFLSKPGRSLAQAALQWVLAHPGVSTVTVGAGSPRELDENVAVTDLPPLTNEELNRIESILE
jgi:aryl-alcohol dehydrogenase-like predicted oxidoreductase